MKKHFTARLKSILEVGYLCVYTYICNKPKSIYLKDEENNFIYIDVLNGYNIILTTEE